MFGYLTAYKEGLSTEDQTTYQGFYCGLCGALKELHGEKSRLVLAYDLVFLSLLYCGLYEEESREKELLCAYKFKKVPVIRTKSDRYAADLNLLLAYHNFRDKVLDEQSKSAAFAVKQLQKDYEETAKRYPRQAKALELYMDRLQAYQKAPDDNPDQAGKLTGEMLAEVFLMQEDEFAVFLRPMFYELGRYIYLADAYADVQKDIESGDYNPYKALYDSPTFDEDVRQHLESIMGNCTRYFEMLPLFLHRDILRNIQYSGAWMGFSKAFHERHPSKEQ